MLTRNSVYSLLWKLLKKRNEFYGFIDLSGKLYYVSYYEFMSINLSIIINTQFVLLNFRSINKRLWYEVKSYKDLNLCIDIELFLHSYQRFLWGVKIRVT